MYKETALKAQTLRKHRLSIILNAIVVRKLAYFKTVQLTWQWSRNITKHYQSDHVKNKTLLPTVSIRNFLHWLIVDLHSAEYQKSSNSERHLHSIILRNIHKFTLTYHLRARMTRNVTYESLAILSITMWFIALNCTYSFFTPFRNMFSRNVNIESYFLNSSCFRIGTIWIQITSTRMDTKFK